MINITDKNKDTTETEESETLYQYHVVHRRLNGDPQTGSLEYIDSIIEGNTIGMGPNYFAIINGHAEKATPVFVCMYDFLDSCTRLDTVVDHI